MDKKVTWKKEHWDKEIYEIWLQYLIAMEDDTYKNFYQKLIPNVNNLIGIRIPVLKKMAAEIAKGNYSEFLKYSGIRFYEEIMVTGLVIGNVKIEDCGFHKIEKYIKQFVPRIDNWSICDSVCAGLKETKKEKEKMLSVIREYLKSDQEFELRFAIIMLKDYYLEEEYLSYIFDVCNQTKQEAYYVRMAVAWLLSDCYVKFECQTVNFFLHNELHPWTLNKAFQKILESSRVPKEKKEQMRKWKKNIHAV